MIWHLSHRADPRAKVLADRHYNRQNPDSAHFVPPGRCLVLLTPEAGAFWVTSWPFGEYVRHAWPGAWICSAFRLERRDLYRASDLIREACAATRYVFGPPPAPHGMVTFVDPDKTRRKRDPGRCYRKAGFVPCEPRTTKGGLIALHLPPDIFPPAEAPHGVQYSMRL